MYQSLMSYIVALRKRPSPNPYPTLASDFDTRNEPESPVCYCGFEFDNFGN